MELQIDMERSKTEEEYRETGNPDRKTEAILLQDLRDEVIIRSVTVRITMEGQLQWIGHIYPPAEIFAPSRGEAEILPEPPEPQTFVRTRGGFVAVPEGMVEDAGPVQPRT
jgi:hypothetical protein